MLPSTSERNFTPSSTAAVSVESTVAGAVEAGQIVTVDDCGRSSSANSTIPFIDHLLDTARPLLVYYASYLHLLQVEEIMAGAARAIKGNTHASLQKGIRILELLAERSPQGVTEMAEQLGLELSGLSRLLQSLADVGY